MLLVLCYNVIDVTQDGKKRNLGIKYKNPVSYLPQFMIMLIEIKGSES